MLNVTPQVIVLYIAGFLVAVLGSLALTPLVRGAARRYDLFDPIDERKLHSRLIPRIGGVAIFVTVMGTLALLWGVSHNVEWGDARKLSVILAGATAIHLLGLWDDLRPMPAKWKFVGQVAIAIGVYLAGVRVELLSVPLGGAGAISLDGVVAGFVTVAWLVGITNAFNLIDGLDGLASGAALFALTTMFVVASIYGQTGAAFVTLVLAGATLGFLFFNFHPASIFLGDSGSLFLGFMLAGIGILSSQKSPTMVALAIPLVSLGLPVLDTALAIFRRFLGGRPIFSADRGHIHHRLLSLGHSPRKVALLLYAACAVLALGAMLMVRQAAFVAFVLLVVGLGVGLAVQRLRFHEFEEFGRVLRKGMRGRDVIGRGVRIREATLQLASLNDLSEIFRVLERIFAQDQFARSEVRLRRTFLAPGVKTSERRGDDEFPVWTWNPNGATAPDWWEIRLPLLGAERERIGSLVLWQHNKASETSLSHFHTIAGHLREEVERKIQDLWQVGSPPVAGGGGYGDADETAVAAGMRGRDGSMAGAREAIAAASEGRARVGARLSTG
ncbi:MAG: undecaprenyl/decaprenyl-phosphate alpha-N-acetylglucosaminyl 1-phosphate transferase [Gemmatimonadota bacterium]|nr:undecaprenyl/decaprenyl-phosphate alpha-N-acetylglucosaminyl 1-phosphate transferase [Gemmatimonadota bacterium]